MDVTEVGSPKVDLSAHATSVEVVKIRAWPLERPLDLTCIGIDIPIGLLDATARDAANRQDRYNSRPRLPQPTDYANLLHSDDISGHGDLALTGVLRRSGKLGMLLRDEFFIPLRYYK